MFIPPFYYHFDIRCIIWYFCKWEHKSKTRTAFCVQSSNSKNMVCLQPVSKPTRPACTLHYSLEQNLAKRQITSLRQNQFSISLVDVKQSHISSFSAQTNPRIAAYHTENTSSSHSCIFAFEIFLAKSSKPSSNPWLLLHLDNIWSTFEPPFITCAASFSLCFSKHTTMAVRAVKFSKQV